jgi:hypothetical protein
MTPFIRNLHRFCVVFQGAWVVIFAWSFVVTPSGTDLFGLIWSVAFGAWSFHALRGERAGVEA